MTARVLAGRARVLGLLLGALADRALGDPRRGHPVAGFGRAAAALERISYGPSRIRGSMHHLVLVGAVAGLGDRAQRRARRHPVVEAALVAGATWTVLGGRSLAREAEAVAGLLEAGELPAARRRLTHLVGRRTEDLDEQEVVRAVVESLAENTSDAVVAPLLWGAVAGVPGLLGYRAVNTLDAMVGHRDERYREFGWCSARCDDLANLLPARVCAALTAALAPTVGGRPADALRAWRRDAPAHPSPNAGPVEAAFAGALGVRLGGVNRYGGPGGGVEDRGLLGDGRRVGRDDLRPALALARRVALASLAVAVAAASARGGPLPGRTQAA